MVWCSVDSRIGKRRDCCRHSSSKAPCHHLHRGPLYHLAVSNCYVRFLHRLFRFNQTTTEAIQGESCASRPHKAFVGNKASKRTAFSGDDRDRKCLHYRAVAALIRVSSARCEYRGRNQCRSLQGFEHVVFTLGAWSVDLESVSLPLALAQVQENISEVVLRTVYSIAIFKTTLE